MATDCPGVSKICFSSEAPAINSFTARKFPQPFLEGALSALVLTGMALPCMIPLSVKPSQVKGPTLPLTLTNYTLTSQNQGRE